MPASSPAYLARPVPLIWPLAKLLAASVSHRVVRTVASAGQLTISEPASFLLLGQHATMKLRPRKGLQPLARVTVARLRAVMSASVTVPVDAPRDITN